MNRRGVWLGALLALVALAAGLWWFTRGSGGALAHRGLEPVGSLRIVAWNRPDPPHVGENQMWIALRDPAGAPVRGALLDVVVSMEAMGTMARMESRAHAVEAAPGIYRAGYA